MSQTLALSISTVSRALKDHPDISQKTKQRVTELANAMDYEPNMNAIHLRTRDNRLFAVIVPSISNFFYDSFISSVEEECRKNAYSLMILQSGDDAGIENNNLKLCRQSGVTGLFACISSNTTDISPFLKLRDLKTPVIFFDKVPETDDCNKVCVADAASAIMAAEVLIRKKKKKIVALFGNEKSLITRKRLQAFQETMAVKSEAEVLINFASDIAEAEKLTTRYLPHNPDAFFCMNDEILTGVIKAIQKKGLHIPNDIGVIAISHGFIPKLYHPEITYVETSGYKLGKLAFSSMMASLGGSTFIQELTTETLLVHGGSL